MNRSNSLFLVVALLLTAVFSRFLPHIGNFTAMLAVSLLGGAWIKRKELAVIIPIAAVLISDLVITNTVHGAYNDGFTFFYPGMAYVYGSYIVIAIAGHHGLKNARLSNAMRFTAFGLGSSALFFLATNFGAWIGNPMYTQDLSGLMTSYAMGLPFLKGTLLGTMAYGFTMIIIKDAVEGKLSATSSAS